MLLIELTGCARGVLAEDRFDRLALVAVVFLGAGAVGVDVVDVGGGEACGVVQGLVHGDDGAAAFGVAGR